MGGREAPPTGWAIRMDLKWAPVLDRDAEQAFASLSVPNTVLPHEAPLDL